MSTFAQLWFEGMTDPSKMDEAGAKGATFENLMKSLATFATDAQRGTFSGADVAGKLKELVSLKNLLGIVNKAVDAAINLSELSAEDLRLRKQMKLFEVRVKAALVAAKGLGTSPTAGLTFGASLFKAMGFAVGVAQIYQGWQTATQKDVTKITVGVAAGMIGGELAGIVAGALTVGLVASGPVGWLAAALIVTVSSVAGGYVVGKGAESGFDLIFTNGSDLLARRILKVASDLYGPNSVEFRAIRDELRADTNKLGSLNGTWLQGFAELSAAQKAAFTLLAFAPRGMRATAFLQRDLTTTFQLPWSGDRLPVRDQIVDSLLSLTWDETKPYDASQIVVADSAVHIDTAKLSDSYRRRLGEAVGAMADDGAGMVYSAAGDVGHWLISSGAIAINWTGSDPVSDGVVGSDQGDNLTGGAGNDVLMGMKGSDILVGGGGTDILVGAEGNDILDGGSGPDYLYGGAGLDRYRFSGDFGGDWITDSDGQGVIDVVGFGELKGQDAKKYPDGIWQTDDGRVVYQLTPSDFGNTLTIRLAGVSQPITIRNWSREKNVGITLSDVAVAPTPPGSSVEIDLGTDAGMKRYRYDPTQTHPQLLGPVTLRNGLLSNLGFVEGGNFNDVIEGGLGLVDNPWAADVPMIARGRDGNDQLYAVVQQTLADAIAGIPAAPTHRQEGYVLDGGRGNDTVVGSGVDDVLFGGAGDDVLVGGAGADIIMSDGDLGEPRLSFDTYGVGDNSGNWATGTYYRQFNGNMGYLYQVRAQDPNVRNGETTTWLRMEAVDPLGNIDFTGFSQANYLNWTPPAGNWTTVTSAAGDVYNSTTSSMAVTGHSMTGWFGYNPAAPTYLDEFNTARHSGQDTVHAGAGDDVVNAGGGDDLVFGEAGNDALSGGAGNDRVFGGDDNDLIYGDGPAYSTDPLVDVLTQRSFGSNGLDPARHGNDLLFGGNGNDKVIGGGGSDQLLGDAGADTLYGDQDGLAAPYCGNDLLSGGTGADLLIGGGGHDELRGGADNDVLWGDGTLDNAVAASHGDDTVYGEDGNDTLYGGGRDDSLLGGAGSDRLIGDAEAGVLPSTLHGSDTLDGGDGDDVLLGSGNDDTLRGGNGNDWLAGEDETTNTVVSTLTGDDDLDGGLGNDTLVGGNGRDHLRGGDGDDALYGGAGDDELDGGAGLDVLDGGAGDDTYILRESDLPTGDFIEFIADDQGSNRVVIEEGTVVSTRKGSNPDDLVLQIGQRFVLIKNGMKGAISRFELADGSVQTLAELLRSTMVDPLQLVAPMAGSPLAGGRAGDLLRTDYGDTWMQGAGGDDTYDWSGDLGGITIGLSLGDGIDRVRGASQSQTIATRGANVIELDETIDPESVRLARRMVDGTAQLTLQYGDAGDYLVLAFSGADWQSLSTSFDMVRFADGSQLTFAELAARGVLIDLGLTNTADATGTFLDEVISGTHLNNLFTGGAGNDTYVFGRGSGVDRVSALLRGAGDVESVQFSNDVLPADVLFVRNDNDLVIRIRGTADVLTVSDAFGANPIDRFRFADGTLFTMASMPLASGDDQATADADLIYVGPGGDALDALGGNDTVIGGTGNDTVHGGDGRDTLYGQAGNDVLYGDVDVDVLDGGDGNDRLDGGEGDDLLSGGAGDDTLIGGFGMDRLTGGDGNDWLEDDGSRSQDTGTTATLAGGNGVDTYRIVRGPGAFGFVTVDAGAGSGEQVILANVMPGETVVRRSGADLVLQVFDATGTEMLTVRLLNQLASGGTPPVGQVRFESSPGTVWSAADLRALAVTGGAGADSLIGFDDLNDNMSGGAGKDTLFGGSGNDTLSGGTGDDYLAGQSGNDTYLLSGDGGSDTVVDLEGSNLVQVAAGITQADVAVVRTGSFGSPDSLVLVVVSTGAQIRLDQYFQANGTGPATVLFGDGTRWSYDDLVARAGASIDGPVDTQTGGAGDDVFVVNNTSDAIIEQAGAGNDTVRSSVSYTLPNNVENLELTGVLGNYGIGNAGANLIRGNAGNNLLDGMGGADTLYGGGGNDLYRWLDRKSYAGTYLDGSFFVPATPGVVELAGEGVDTIETNAFSMTLPTNVENLLVTSLITARGITYRAGETFRYAYTGNASNNLIDLGAGTANFAWVDAPVMGTTIDGGAGADTMRGSLIDDTYMVDDAGDVVVETSVWGDGRQRSVNDMVVTGLAYTLGANLERLVLTGGNAVAGSGNELGNTLDGSGNAAANLLTGFTGDDTYRIGLNDTVVEAAGAGTDTVVVESLSGQAVTSLSIASFANIEVLKAGANVGDIDLVGTAGNDVLYGSRASNRIDGGAGNDALYSLDIRTVPYNAFLGRNDYLASSDVLDAGDGNDTLEAWGGADTLLGGAGQDELSVHDATAVLDGGSGNDTLLAIASHLMVVFGQGSGADTVSTDSLRRAAWWASTHTGGSAVQLTANTDASRLRFTQQDTSLVISLAGTSDTLRVDNFFDFFTGEMRSDLDSVLLAGNTRLSRDAIAIALGRDSMQAPTAEADVLIASPTGSAVAAGDGNDMLYGQAGADLLSGDAGDDMLRGATGDDTLIGGFGNDTLIGGAGADEYRFSLGWGSDVVAETLDAEEIGGTWSSTSDTATNTISFDASVNAADLRGLQEGDDLIITHAVTGDSIRWAGYLSSGAAPGQIRFADGNTWDSARVMQLLAEVTGTEDNDYLTARPIDSRLHGQGGNDTLNGSTGADQLFGDDGFDQLYGNGGNDTLDGGAGGDQMYGGIGDDTYVVDSSDDRIAEYEEEGNDTVLSSIGLTLGNFVENLVLTGSQAPSGTGNTLGNRITGNSGANAIDGKLGADTMAGGAGDDTYTVDVIGDVVIEAFGEGIDLVKAGASFTLGDNVENLTLTGSSGLSGTGNALANILIGNGGANRLDGKEGADQMTGGAGNDTYVLDDIGDRITELSGGGTDTVESTISWTLLAELEKLTLLGSQNLTATGNSVANTLIGNAGNNVLDGGGGVDTMIGGTGDDTYYVDVLSETITELSGQGIDTVNSLVNFTLGNNSNLENLNLIGSGNVTGTGNDLDNLLFGNSGNNALAGGTGNDTYYGGGGTDAMNDTVTTSNDVYRWGRGDGQDTITDAGGSDRIEISSGITAAQLTQTRSGNNLVLGISGVTADKLTITNWYVGTANKIETIRLADGTTVPITVTALSSSAVPTEKAMPAVAAAWARLDVAMHLAEPTREGLPTPIAVVDAGAGHDLAGPGLALSRDAVLWRREHAF